MSKDFEIVEETLKYDGFFQIKTLHLKHTLFEGGWSPVVRRELFVRGNCVAVLLYDPHADAVVIIEQFRVGAIDYGDERTWLLEVVAGAIEPGETPVDVAYRESIEEAGAEIKELISISDFFTSPGGTSEMLHLFCGRIDSSEIGGFHGVEDENEDIKVDVLPFDEVYQLLEDGKIISAIPIIAIQWLALNRDKLRQQWT